MTKGRLRKGMTQVFGASELLVLLSGSWLASPIMTKAHDYSTSAFLLHWDHFVTLCGRPTKVVSDQGSQLIASDNSIKFDSLKWEQVEGCQRRNGLAKSRVTAIKVTLKYMPSSTCPQIHALHAEWRDAAEDDYRS